MSGKMKRVACLAVLITLMTALLPPGSSEDEGLPIYRVANLLRLQAADAMYYARKLSEQIATLSGEGRSESTNEDLGKCCREAPKHGQCEEVSARVETLIDKKQVYVSVEEYGPHRQSGELASLSCVPSMTDLDCYRSLVKKMANAVEKHDEDCHRGRKCQTANGHFVPVVSY
jgi:hypothetical protein